MIEHIPRDSVYFIWFDHLIGVITKENVTKQMYKTRDDTVNSFPLPPSRGAQWTVGPQGTKL